MRSFSKIEPESIYVRHIRFDLNGNCLRRQLKSNGLTLALVVMPNQKVGYAQSWCSIKDQFCRKLGRTIAIGRARAAAFYGIVLEQPPPLGKERHEWAKKFLDYESEGYA